VFIDKTADDMNKHEAQRQAAQGNLDKDIEDYKALLVDGEQKYWDDANGRWESYKQKTAAINDLMLKGDTEGALKIINDTLPDYTAVMGSVEEWIKFNNDLADTQIKTASSAYSSAKLMTVGVMIFAALLALAIGYFLAQSMTTALKAVVSRLASIQEHEISDVTAGMLAMAQGDLTIGVTPVTAKIDKYPNDEVGQAAASVNDIIDKMVTTIGSYNSTRGSLTELITGISKNVETLTDAKNELGLSADQAAEATQQIAQTTTQVAEGTNQTAKSVQDVSTSMSELDQAIAQVSDGTIRTSRSVQDVNESVAQLKESALQLEETAKTKVAYAADEMAANAQAATEGARAATDTAHNGARMVQLTIDGMQRIKNTVNTASEEITELGTRSQEIGNIVEVIDDIAAQTNLLALNAAIEAARAGEQGRGFAVVADEVRKLAERVASATKEISALITGIQRSVESSVKVMAEGAAETENGARVAAEAGAALEEILAAVENVNTQMDRIAAGSQELRSSGSEMVGVAGNVRGVVETVSEAVINIAGVAEQNSSATEQMRATASTVSDAMENIAGVAEENSATTEEVSASAEEMTAQVEEVTAAAHALGGIAEDLKAKVAMFKLDSAIGREPVALQPDGRRAAA
jgi:methyl-accepting chemotaxis protein